MDQMTCLEALTGLCWIAALTTVVAVILALPTFIVIYSKQMVIAIAQHIVTRRIVNAGSNVHVREALYDWCRRHCQKQNDEWIEATDELFEKLTKALEDE